MHRDRMHTTIAASVAIALIVIALYYTSAGLASKRSAGQSSSSSSSSSSNRLQFRRQSQGEERVPNSSYVFHILQLADIHLGENSWTVWGPEQDRKTWIALDRLILLEQPDLIVLSGDQLTANNVDVNATAYYLQLGHKLNTYGIPWALIFGNHDDAPFEQDGVVNGTIDHFPAKTSRRQLLETHRDFDLSLTLPGPESVTGVSNYWLDLFLPLTNDGDSDDDGEQREEKIAARVLLLDSGGGTLTQQIDSTQLDWYLETRPLDPNLPVVAFQHIPSSVEDFSFESTQCQGFTEDGVAGLQNDAGIVEALSDAENVHFLAVGHNHGNDYCCRHTPSLYLCFGRHSGYGGYGRWDRGARVYQLQLNQTGGWMGWKSWVRMESGEVVDEYDPEATT